MFGSDQPGKYLIGLKDSTSILANTTRKLTRNSMLSELVSPLFLKTYLPSANKAAGPLFPEKVMEQMEKDWAQKRPQELKYTASSEESTPMTDLFTPELLQFGVIVAVGMQAFAELQRQDISVGLPNLEAGTILMRRDNLDQDALYFEWYNPQLTGKAMSHSDAQYISKLHGWSLKRHAYSIAPFAHPECKWFVIGENVKIYSQPVESDEFKKMRTLPLGSIELQKEKLNGNWLHHRFG